MNRLAATALAIAFCPLTLMAQTDLPATTSLAASPFMHNPGATGLISGDVRATVNYITFPIGNDRYNIVNTSVDARVLRRWLPANDAAGIGMINESNFPGMARRVTGFTGISAAYHKGLGNTGQHHLSVGAQAIVHATQRTNYRYGGGLFYSGKLSGAASAFTGYSIQTTPYFTGSRSAAPGDIAIAYEHTMIAGAVAHAGRRVDIYAHTMLRYLMPETRWHTGAYTRVLINKPGIARNREMAIFAGAYYTNTSNYYRLSPCLGFEAGPARLGLNYQRYTTYGPTHVLEVTLIYTGAFRKSSRQAAQFPRLF